MAIAQRQAQQIARLVAEVAPADTVRIRLTSLIPRHILRPAAPVALAERAAVAVAAVRAAPDHAGHVQVLRLYTPCHRCER